MINDLLDVKCDFMKNGDFIQINYTGRIKETGELFDTTNEDIAKKENIYNPNARYGPIPIIVGAGKVVKGLDENLLEMKVGEKKEIEVQPEKAFGKRNPKLIKLIPLAEFKKQNMIPYPGMIITMNNVRGRVLSASSGRIKVDFNHPLASKTLVYDVKIEEKIDGKENKIKSICEYYNVKAKIEIKDKEVEILLEKEAPENIKKAITNDINKHISFDKVKFSRIFEAPENKENK